jgi:hypothetical protein
LLHHLPIFIASDEWFTKYQSGYVRNEDILGIYSMAQASFRQHGMSRKKLLHEMSPLANISFVFAFSGLHGGLVAKCHDQFP